MLARDTATPMHPQPEDGHQLRLVTDLVTVKATTAATGDAFALYETETPPAGGCPTHTERYDDIALYVIEGQYAVLIGDERIELEPGGFAYIPRGMAHGYTNTGAAPARLLVIATPGGIHEQFLAEVGDRATRGAWEPDMDRLLAVAPKYGITFATDQAPVPAE